MNKNVDSRYMQRAIELALCGKGRTTPNPLVGAVIVQDNLIVGEGFHPQAGMPHAEIYALEAAAEKAKGSTLYVNLEPCCHYGKTPPCTQAIIRRQIKKVIIGTKDPNPLVSGKGIKELRKAGIVVEWGIMRDECQEINRIFFKYIRTKMPFVILKAGLSLDGKIATGSGESKWITGKESRAEVQKIRSEVDAVMVGIGTIVKDDPRLNLRLRGWSNKNLRKIILDPELRISLTSKVLSVCPERTIVVTGLPASVRKANEIKKTGAEIIFLKKNKEGIISLKDLMVELGKRNIISLMIEGGSRLNALALKEGIVDKMVFFMAPVIIGGKDSIPVIGGEGIKKLSEAIRIKEMKIRSIGKDLMVEGMLK